MFACGGLLLLVVLVALAVWCGSWILRPLDQAAKNSQRRPQFTLGDFLCLFLLVQLPTGLIHAWLRDVDSIAIWVLDAYGWGACGALWWVSVRTLSRAGVQNPWQRGVSLVVVLPISCFGSITAVVLPVMLVALLANGEELPIGLLVAIEAGLVVGLLACSRFTRWMVAVARGPAGSPFADASEGPGDDRP